MHNGITLNCTSTALYYKQTGIDTYWHTYWYIYIYTHPQAYIIHTHTHAPHVRTHIYSYVYCVAYYMQYTHIHILHYVYIHTCTFIGFQTFLKGHVWNIFARLAQNPLNVGFPDGKMETETVPRCGACGFCPLIFLSHIQVSEKNKSRSWKLGGSTTFERAVWWNDGPHMAGAGSMCDVWMCRWKEYCKNV